MTASASPSTLSIRPARADDLPQLLALYALLDVGAESRMPLEAAIAWFRELASNPRQTIYVGLKADAPDVGIVGTFALVFIPGLPHGARESGIVEDVVVARHCQRSGIGREMMRFAMERCAERGCYKLVLSSHTMRESAHRFYEALGFRRHGYSFLIDPAGRVAAGDQSTGSPS